MDAGSTGPRCTKCQQVFSSPSQLSRHKAIAHGTWTVEFKNKFVVIKGRDDGTARCQCDRHATTQSFSTAEGLKNHIYDRSAAEANWIDEVSFSMCILRSY